MSFISKTSFSGGELDPALRKRITLEKFNSALAKARNCLIGKTGRVINTGGTIKYILPKVDGKDIVIASIPFTPYLVEFGHLYIRVHNSDDATYYDVPGANVYDETVLDLLHFTPSNYYGRKSIVIFLKDEVTYRLVADNPGPSWSFNATEMKPANRSFSATGVVTASTGFLVDYVVTAVDKDGQEWSSLQTATGGPFAKPINPGQSNKISIVTPSGLGGWPDKPIKFNIYSRPTDGGAWGYLGAAANVTAGGGGSWHASYQDLGEDPDYSHSPPTDSSDIDPTFLKAKTGTIIQSRLLVANCATNVEEISASRVKYEGNFTRDYPLNDVSALTFKCGSSGAAEVLRMLDNGALIAFTTIGVFANEDGALTVANIAMKNKGEWVIDEKIPPLKIPGAVLFVDVATNSVRSLEYSTEANGYLGEELSIFSNHLFQNKRIVSWSFQGGVVPLVWVVFDDGSAAALTYQREQKMRAWTPQDTLGKFKQVTTVRSSSGKFKAFFVVKRGNKRIIEYTADRFPKDQKQQIMMHSTVSKSLAVHTDKSVAYSNFTLTPVVTDEWGGELTLHSIAATKLASLVVGQVLKIFTKTNVGIELEVTTLIDGQNVIVTPSETLSEDVQAPWSDEDLQGFILYYTYSSVAGLGHIEGYDVSILADGEVLASPNNDIVNYDLVTVTGGSVTLPESRRAAFIHVGLPYTSDIQTLNIDSIDGKSVILENKLVNRVVLEVKDTRGVYVGANLPADNKVNGMGELDKNRLEVDPANTTIPLRTGQSDVIIEGEYSYGGQICTRQVDPLSFELTAIIPDVQF